MKSKITLSIAVLLFTSTHAAQAAQIYTCPVAGCEVTYSRYHHDYPAADIFGKKGCAFVSPIAGVVDEVNTVDRWRGKTNIGADRGGLSVSVIGDDGLRYYGSHLSKIESKIVPGYRVTTGGKVR